MRITHPQLEQARLELYRQCVDYAAQPSIGRTLVIYGENGAGKTHLARCVAFWARRIALKIPLEPDRLTEQQNIGLTSVFNVKWPEIVDGFKHDEWQILEDLQACTFLVIDDAGSEHDPSRVGLEKLYVLLNRREFRWNLLTTNIKPEHWPEKFERRIASRLNRNAIHLDLSQVPDYSTT